MTNWEFYMEEMFDTFDVNGYFLGVKSKSFCHGENPGVYHKPVWIWIVNDKGEILVQKRAKVKKLNPSKWDMPSAGHVHAGESCVQGCIRETEEELGIKCDQKDFVFLKQFINKKGWELAQVYLLKINTRAEDMILQPEEVEIVKWVKYDEFVKLLYSEEFVAHEKNFKDWTCEILKNV